MGLMNRMKKRDRLKIIRYVDFVLVPTGVWVCFPSRSRGSPKQLGWSS